MKRGLHLGGCENDNLPELPEPPGPQRRPPRGLVDLGDVWAKELTLLRTFPQFASMDVTEQQRLIWGSNNLRSFPGYSEGLFTLRKTASKASRMVTLEDSIAQDKTHSVQAVYDKPNGAALFVFWVDLRLAFRYTHQAKVQSNGFDGNEYWLFDWRDPAVGRFAQRFTLRGNAP